MMLRLAAYAILAVPFGAVAALAQSDPMAAARAASSNQLGVLEYCQSQGNTGSDAITAQHRVMAQLPGAGADQAAEALGKTGTISANGTTMTLASLASSHNTTIAALCKQMASTVTQAAQSMPAGGMPTMPSGMPTMPAMPAMPSMPAMPAMPGTAAPAAPAQ